MEPATVDTQQGDTQTMKRTWTIEHFSKLKTKKLYSDVFTVGDYKWRILMFPKGNNNVDYLSMYLDVADSQTLPYGWSRNADFSLGLVNHLNSKSSIRKETKHLFCARESDWGFTSFAPLGDLYDPSRGFLVDDTVIVEVEFSVGKGLCPLVPAITETSKPQEETKNDKATIMLPEANLVAEPTRQDEMKVETHKDASLLPMPSVQDDGSSHNDDVIARRLSATEELLKSTSEIPPSAEALAALDTVKRTSGSSLATLCVDGAYEEFTTALKLLTEQQVIPSKITSMLKDLLQSLQCEIPNIVAAEKEHDQSGENIAAQHEEIKTQVEMAVHTCHELKDSLANYDARVAELEAELAVVKEKRAETTTNLKAAVDEMEPLRQRFVDSSSRSESFTVRQAMYGASLGTWAIVQDVLKNFLK